jgi:hypothetical protein
MQNDYQRIKNSLPIPYVMEQEGHDPQTEEAGTIKYFSPFRQDSNPSFDVWYDEDKGWRWGDFTEGGTNDVLDLLKRFYPDGNEAELAWKLIAGMPAGWEPPSLAPRQQFNVETATAKTGASYEDVNKLWENRFFALWQLDEVGYTAEYKPGMDKVTPRYLVDEWRVSCWEDRLIAPYYDSHGTLVNNKSLPDGRNDSGSKASLYGIWRLNEQPIVLVEGETDAWAAQRTLGDGYLVLAVPGAGVRPETIGEQVKGRDLILAFDSDSAGRDGMARWASWCIENGGGVHIVAMPEGKDVCDLTGKEFLACLNDKRAPRPAPDEGRIARKGGVFGKVIYRKDETTFESFSNWGFDVKRVLSDEEQTYYEGVLQPDGRDAVLPSAALLSPSSLARWATANGGSWTGGAGTSQHLAALLQSEELWLPRGKAVKVMGLHEGTFVWKGNKIGPANITYVPPAADTHLNIQLPAGEVDRGAAVDTMMSLYSPQIMSPMLSWCMAAFTRGHQVRFPFMMIFGVRGTGKTETTQYVMNTFFGGNLEGSISGSTKHAIRSAATASNVWPLWIDEYRASPSRTGKETQSEVQAILRGAWNGEASTSGGGGNPMEIITSHYTAPLVVSGEDQLSDPALVQRCLFLRFTKAEMRKITEQGRAIPKAIPAVGRDIMTWMASDAAGAILRGDILDPRPTTHKNVENRQNQTMGLLTYGHNLLANWVRAQNPNYHMPNLDLTGLVSDLRSMNNNDDLGGAIRSMVDDDSCEGAVYTPEHDIIIRLQPFLDTADRMVGVDLSVSKRSALRDLLIEEYHAEEVRTRVDGAQVRGWLINKESMVN